MLFVQQENQSLACQIIQAVLPRARLVELIALRSVLTVQLDPQQIYQSARQLVPIVLLIEQLVVFLLAPAQMLVVLAVVLVETLEILTQHQFLLVVVIRYGLFRLPE